MRRVEKARVSELGFTVKEENRKGNSDMKKVKVRQQGEVWDFNLSIFTMSLVLHYYVTTKSTIQSPYDTCPNSGHAHGYRFKINKKLSLELQVNAFGKENQTCKT